MTTSATTNMLSNRLIGKTVTRTLHHDFLYISLPPPHDVNVNTLGGIDR